MEELVKIIVGKTGISEGQARSAIEAVSGYLKAKLPGPLAGQVDAALGAAGGAVQNIDVGSVASGIGNLFGKK